MKKCFVVFCAFAIVFAVSAESPAYAKTVFKISNQFPSSHNISKALVFFAEKVKEYSNEEIEAQLFDAGQLYKDTEILEALQDNLVECGVATLVRWSGMIGLIDIFELPFAFKDYAAVKTFLDRGGDEIFTSEFRKKGVQNLAWLDNAFNQMFNNKHPLKVPADFKGLTMRSIGKGDSEILSALGAAPTVMSSSELYMALQRGTMDGTTTTMDAAVSRKLLEVQKYMTESNYSVSEIVLQANLEWWDGLPAATRDILIRAARDTEAWVRSEITAVDDKSRETLLAAGMEIYHPTDESRQLYIEATQSLREKYLQKTGETGKKLLDLAEAASR
ncbi:MAG: TRAP transporter substrate-binding protein DctP [Synergistaceae bacterium]|jgi:C4-dicarboxylate-binding protein DctP|nr:TRAP transporter substrate-binding protein DctP [Synergistaceae bacterium]